MLTQTATMKLMIKSKWCSQRNSSGCNDERLWIVRGSDDVQGGLCQQNPPSSVISVETPAKNIFFNLWDLTACRLCLSSLLQTVWSPTAHRRVSSWCRPAIPSPASTTPPTTECTRGGEWLERFLFSSVRPAAPPHISPHNHTNHVAFFSYCIFHPPEPSEPPFLTFTHDPFGPWPQLAQGPSGWNPPQWNGTTPPPFQNNLCHQLPWVEFSSSVLQQAAVSWAALATGVLLHIGRYKNMAIKMLHKR